MVYFEIRYTGFRLQTAPQNTSTGDENNDTDGQNASSCPYHGSDESAGLERPKLFSVLLSGLVTVSEMLVSGRTAVVTVVSVPPSFNKTSIPAVELDLPSALMCRGYSHMERVSFEAGEDADPGLPTVNGHHLRRVLDSWVQRDSEEGHVGRKAGSL